MVCSPGTGQIELITPAKLGSLHYEISSLGSAIDLKIIIFIGRESNLS
jgi:hypothetical protein